MGAPRATWDLSPDDVRFRIALSASHHFTYHERILVILPSTFSRSVAAAQRLNQPIPFYWPTVTTTSANPPNAQQCARVPDATTDQYLGKLVPWQRARALSMPTSLASHASTPPVPVALPKAESLKGFGATTAAMDTSAAPPTAADRRRDKRSWDYIWRSGVAGGLAGCAAKTTVAPLDRVKILFQSGNPQFAKYTGSWAGVVEALTSIKRQEGASGLFRGHSATLLRIFPYAAIKFLAYEQVRAVIIPTKNHETPLRRLASGAIAGVTSVFFTYPLEVIRVRLAFETNRDGRSSLSAICKKIYHEQPVVRQTASAAAHNAPAPVQVVADAAAATVEAVAPRSGLVNFYRGFSPTMLGMVPYAGMSFLTHDMCGDLLRHPLVAVYTTLPQPKNAPPGKAAPLRSWAELCAGGAAGLVSQTASYPLEVIRRRMQVGGAVGDGHRLKIAETARLIMKERGFRGFFVGLTIGYAKVVPLAAVSFYTYERMKMVLGI